MSLCTCTTKSYYYYYYYLTLAHPGPWIPRSNGPSCRKGGSASTNQKVGRVFRNMDDNSLRGGSRRCWSCCFRDNWRLRGGGWTCWWRLRVQQRVGNRKVNRINRESWNLSPGTRVCEYGQVKRTSPLVPMREVKSGEGKQSGVKQSGQV